MGAPSSMKALMGRRLDLAEQRQLLKMFAKIQGRGGNLTPREVEVQRMLRKLEYNRGYSGHFVSLEEAVAGLLKLDEVERTRPLTHQEAERRGELVAREQRWAPSRPQRIAALRAELELLEGLQLADGGAGALDHIDSVDLDFEPDSEGRWSAAKRNAA